MYWGYANDLIDDLNEEYSKVINPRTKEVTYDYKTGNYLSSNVHAMLSMALMKMMDCCECLIFIDSTCSLYYLKGVTGTMSIVLISPNMKNPHSYDKSQWIPWEIRYSLVETVRGDRKSHRNAILAVVLPDRNGSYEYALRSNACCSSGCTTYIRDWMFTIIKKNLFNRKRPTTVECQRESTIWHGEFNYIPMVRWEYFKNHVTELIERAERIKDDYERNNSYELHLSVNQ